MSSHHTDFELTTQLYSFMESVPVLWGWGGLSQLRASDETYTEARGPADNFIQFALQVLDDGTKNGQSYLHVFVRVTDASRVPGRPGSSTTPLSTSFLLFETGEVDMPHGRDIYESAFMASNKSLERTREG
jgi:hypothetical protein